MNIRTTLILLGVAILLGFVAIVRLRTTASGSGDEVDTARLDRTNQPLFADGEFDPDAITTVRLNRAMDESAFSFVKEADGTNWRQTEPVDYGMDSWSLRQLVTNAADLRVTATLPVDELEGELEPGNLGLNPPAATMTFEPASGDPIDLQLGRIYTGGKAYVRLTDDGPVYVVNDDLHKRVLDGDPMEWRNKVIFEDLGAEASRFTITGGDAPAVKLRKVDGEWRMTEPIRTHVDSNAVNRLVSELSSARVRGFITDKPDDLSKFGLDDPTAALTVEADRAQGDGSVETDSQSLVIGNPIDLAEQVANQTFYGKRGERDTVFTLRGRSVEALTPTAESIISKVPVAANAENIAKVTVRGQGGAFTLERATEGWTVTTEGGAPEPADDAAVQALLAAITTPQVEVSLSELAGDETILGRVSVEGFNGGSLGTVALATKRGETIEVATPAPDTLIFDDGSGALRLTPGAEPPALTAAAYQPAPLGPEAPVEEPAVEPVK
ncbi:MAG: DUF4340 domain-containing protein [Phycisphaerales bacterium]